MKLQQFQGWTIENMVKDNNHKVRAGGQTASEYLLWVCDVTKGFTWRWKDIDHVHLLLGLWDQYCTKEKQGLKLEVHTGNGKKTLDVQPLMYSYSKWLENLGFFKESGDDVEDNNNADLDFPRTVKPQLGYTSLDVKFRINAGGTQGYSQRTTSSLHSCPMHSSQFYRESTTV